MTIVIITTKIPVPLDEAAQFAGGDLWPLDAQLNRNDVCFPRRS
jgi:hypothetical protein